MSYGQNAPWGLQAIRTQTDASWNGKTSTYLIASGYAQNIFKGDLVYISSAGAPLGGYIRNLFDYVGAGGATFASTPALGVFDGCSFAVPTSVNPIDPANPGRPYWPAGTNTVGGIPAIASIITDPNVVYNAQTTLNGAVQLDVRKNVSVAYTAVAGIVQGNFNTGTSLVTINMATAVSLTPPTPVDPTAAGQLNCFIDSLSTNSQNVSGQQYNNVEVMIANHYFRVMATLGATA